MFKRVSEHLFLKVLIVVPLLVFSFGSKNYWITDAHAQDKSTKKSMQLKKTVSIPKVDVSSESGVKLLIGILQRIGNVPALAMQQQSMNSYAPPPPVESVPNQIFGQNLTDPALAIRPQVRRQSAANQNYISQVSMGKAKKADNLIASSTRMYQLSKTIDELDRAANSYEPQSSQASNAAPARGIVISNAPRITEYGAGSSASGSSGSSIQTKNETAMRTIVGAIKEANQEQLSRMTDAEESYAPGGQKNAKRQVIKLEQPAYYKHIREYDEKKSSKDQKQIVAYNPPSMVFGIAGLQLGASNNDVGSYLKSQFGTDKSKFKSFKYKEWLVWSLQEPTAKGERTTLQIFSRANQVEALRIFDDKYIPDAVNVRLADTMAVMKNRFGEPAFVLEEPQVKDSSKTNERKMIKNYVYPVSQVSFQLVRGESGGSPVVTSVLLFKFL
ncbi:MAG: hypothetical protein KIT34_04175 [Cyanobacteria bacterium TGS_CYA1]|nr:hypothetical protein [Cyanobacteria bacterium TGS_CYA1]